jgi:hypothetical protein
VTRYFHSPKPAISDEDGVMGCQIIKIGGRNGPQQWQRDWTTEIDFGYPNEYAITAPRVPRHKDGFIMWYAFRAGPVSETYRNGKSYGRTGVGLAALATGL